MYSQIKYAKDFESDLILMRKDQKSEYPELYMNSFMKSIKYIDQPHRG